MGYVKLITEGIFLTPIHCLGNLNCVSLRPSTQSNEEFSSAWERERNTI